MTIESLFSTLDRRQSVTVSQLAQLTAGRFSRGQIAAYCRAGIIPGAVRQGKGRWKISRDGAEKWWTKVQQTPANAAD